MRAPPVRSYIHIALPSARATFGLIRPSFEKIGMRNGSSRTRCGAFAAQPLALAQRLVHEADVAVLQVAQPAVHELRALRRRAAGEVVALDQRGAQAAAGGVERHPGAGDPAADHEHVERLGAQLLQRSRRGRTNPAPSGQPQPQAPPQQPPPPVGRAGRRPARPGRGAREHREQPRGVDVAVGAGRRGDRPRPSDVAPRRSSPQARHRNS